MWQFETRQDGNPLLIYFISVDWLVSTHFDICCFVTGFLSAIARIFTGFSVAVFQQHLERFLSHQV